MSGKFADQVAVVTGASTGIGFAIALALGCSLIILPHVPSMAKKALSALMLSAQGD